MARTSRRSRRTSRRGSRDSAYEEKDLAVDIDDYGSSELVEEDIDDIDDAGADDSLAESGGSSRSSRRGRTGGGGGTSRRGRASRRTRGGDDEDEASGSSRRSRGKSSAKSARGSSRKSSRQAKSKKDLSPAEKAARKSAMIRYLGLAAAVLVMIAFLIVFLSPDKTEVRAREVIGEAKLLTDRARSEMELGQIESAREAHQEAASLLDQPFFNEPQHPEYAGVGLARQADALEERLRRLQTRLQEAADLKAVEENAEALQERVQNIDQEEDLEALRADVTAFAANPVDPDAMADPDAAEEYSGYVQQISDLNRRVEDEMERRERMATTDVASEASGEVSVLVNQKRFGAALEYLDQTAEEYPDADLAPLRTRVNDAAERSWNVAIKNAASFYQDAVAPSISESVQKQRREKMEMVLQAVVDTYGIDEYVDRARQLLADPSPLAQGPDAYLK